MGQIESIALTWEGYLLSELEATVASFRDCQTFSCDSANLWPALNKTQMPILLIGAVDIDLIFNGFRYHQRLPIFWAIVSESQGPGKAALEP